MQTAWNQWPQFSRTEAWVCAQWQIAHTSPGFDGGFASPLSWLVCSERRLSRRLRLCSSLLSLLIWSSSYDENCAARFAAHQATTGTQDQT